MSLVAATFLVLASGGSNSQPANAKPPEATEEADPMICQADNVLGSRIKRKRICMRRSEWQRQRLEEKMMIERTQVQRGMNPAG